MTEIQTTYDERLKEHQERAQPIQKEIDHAREMVLFNLESIMHNAGDMDKLEASTQHLMEQGARFKKNTSNLRKRYWWEKYKVPILFGSGVTLTGVVTTLIFVL